MLIDELKDYAIWSGDHTMICSLDSAHMERGIAEGLQIVKIIRSVSYNEAHQAYNDYFGYGEYKPMDEGFIDY